MRYNGWKNKETWLVNLWLGDSLQCDLEDGIEVTPYYIEELVEDLARDFYESGNGFMVDLLNCAIGEIDFYEIAEYYKESEQ